MSVMANDPTRPLRLTVQEIGHDRRGLRRLMVFAAGGQVIRSSSPNPVACSAGTLLNRNLDPATLVTFADAAADFEQTMTLAEAIALDDAIVPFRRREQR